MCSDVARSEYEISFEEMWARIGQEGVAITKKMEMDWAYLEEGGRKHHQNGHDMEPE